MSSVMRLILNQSHLAVKWVILRFLRSSDEVFGRDSLEELRLLGSAQGGGSSTKGALYLCMRSSILKGLGKKCGKE